MAKRLTPANALSLKNKKARRKLLKTQLANPCSLCGSPTPTSKRLNLFRKSRELRLAERLSSDGKKLGARRVCYKCWFSQTTNAMTTAELAATVVLLIEEGIYAEMREGSGRLFEERLSRTLQKLTGEGDEE